MSDDGARHQPTGEDTPGIRERFRYRFDNLLARGTSATLIWLGAVTLAAVLVSSVLLAIFGVGFAGSEDNRWVEDAWQSMLRVLDAGTMASDVGWGRRILALAMTIFGLLVAGTLIGIIAAGVEDRIEQMRRGRSVVIESDHVVVLGASDRLPVVLQQLVLAGAEGGSRTIVVLADLDPAEMHSAARGAAIAEHRGIQIVFRSGDPTNPGDLALVRLPTARSVVVLSDGRSDMTAVTTVLAIAAELGGLDDTTVVVELLDDDSARRLRRAFGRSIHPLVMANAIARTTAFALRQRGLNQVLDELTDFRGDDLHVVERPDLVGKSFGKLVRGLQNARPIALRHADETIDLCPSFDTLLGPGDEIVVIASDSGRLEFSDRGDANETGTSDAGHDRVALIRDIVRTEERLVMIGWNESGRRMLTGWASATAPTSQVELIVDPNHVDAATTELPDLGSIRVVITPAVDVIGTAVERDPTTLVLLSSPGDPDGADVRTALDLEAVRRELGARDPAPRLVVELVGGAGHEPLIDLDGPDDLIVSDVVGSHFLAQLVDQPARRDVLLALYAADGAGFGLIPCEGLGLVGDRGVAELVDGVASRGLLLIGWRHVGSRVVLNPHLSDRVVLTPGDQLVVVG